MPKDDDKCSLLEKRAAIAAVLNRLAIGVHSGEIAKFSFEWDGKDGVQVKVSEKIDRPEIVLPFKLNARNKDN